MSTWKATASLPESTWTLDAPDREAAEVEAREEAGDNATVALEDLTPPPPDPSAERTTEAVIAAADQLDAMNVSYRLGGGHNTPSDASNGLDCSSAVSWVMQHAGFDVDTVGTSNLNSKWASIMEPWSSSQDGVFVVNHPDPDGSGGRSGHVFLVINGRKFQNTSANNLGASWQGSYTIRGGTFTEGTHDYKAWHIKGTGTPSTPPPPPPTGTSDLRAYLNLTGPVLQADYMTDFNPLRAPHDWGLVTNGNMNGGNADTWAGLNDSQCVHSNSGGDLKPRCDGLVHPGSRYMTTVGPDSLWDARKQPGSTRAQIGGLGADDNFHASANGTRDVFFFQTTLDSPTLLNRPIGSGGGNVYFSMVFQTKPLGGGDPILSLYEGNNGMKLVASKSHVTQWLCARGEPLRYALDILHGSNGAYRLHADLNDGLGWRPLTDKKTGATGGVYNMGPYHVIKTSSKDGQVKHGRRYGAVEIIKREVSDPW